MVLKIVIAYIIASYFIIPILFFINEKYNADFGIFWYSESTDTKYNNFCKTLFIAPFSVILFILQEVVDIIAKICEFITTLLYETIMKLCNKEESM